MKGDNLKIYLKKNVIDGKTGSLNLTSKNYFLNIFIEADGDIKILNIIDIYDIERNFDIDNISIEIASKSIKDKIEEVFFLVEGRRMSISQTIEGITFKGGRDFYVKELKDNVEIDFSGQSGKEKILNSENMNFKNPIIALNKIFSKIFEDLKPGILYSAEGTDSKRSSIYKRKFKRMNLSYLEFRDDIILFKL